MYVGLSTKYHLSKYLIISPSGILSKLYQLVSRLSIGWDTMFDGREELDMPGISGRLVNVPQVLLVSIH